MNEELWRMNEDWWRMMISSCLGFCWRTDWQTNQHLWLQSCSCNWKYIYISERSTTSGNSFSWGKKWFVTFKILVQYQQQNTSIKFSKIVLCCYSEVLHNFDNLYHKSQDYNQDNHVVCKKVNIFVSCYQVNCILLRLSWLASGCTALLHGFDNPEDIIFTSLKPFVLIYMFCGILESLICNSRVAFVSEK